MWIGSLGPRMFWGTRATNFSIYTTKMEGAGLKILGTGAKFKQVPCQKNCRVNRAISTSDRDNYLKYLTNIDKQFQLCPTTTDKFRVYIHPPYRRVEARHLWKAALVRFRS